MLRIIVTNLIGIIVTAFIYDRRTDRAAPVRFGARTPYPAQHTNDHSVDFAEILRTACLNGREQVVLSRNDALGAAVEIEQLWVAFSILTGFVDDDGLPISRAHLKTCVDRDRIHSG